MKKENNKTNGDQAQETRTLIFIVRGLGNGLARSRDCVRDGDEKGGGKEVCLSGSYVA
jgi:hypothetical protein